MKYGWQMAAAATFMAAALQVPTTAVAGDLVYTPKNPSFGGNPNNFDSLIGLAQIQNQHTADGGGDSGGGVPDISFPPIVIDLGGTDDLAADDAAGDQTSQ